MDKISDDLKKGRMKSIKNQRAYICDVDEVKDVCQDHSKC